MFEVRVTYGTRKNQVYTAVPNLEDARNLKAAAISLGYADALVVAVEVDDRRPPREDTHAKDLAEATWVAEEGEAGPRTVARKGRGVRNMRRQSEKAQYATPA
jgi:hypothetical protein